MAQSTQNTHAATGNPLLVPLIVVAAIALIEAVVVAVLLVRDSPQAAAPNVPAGVASDAAAGVSGAPSASARTPEGATDPAQDTAGKEEEPAVGKVGERVDSSGFGITVEKVLHEPATYKGMVSVNADQRYLALLVLVENDTGGNAGLFPSTFVLKDDQEYTYDQLGIHGTMPVLEWRTLANREKVRGHIDFVIPKSARGLVLTYWDTSRPGAVPIQIELGE